MEDQECSKESSPSLLKEEEEEDPISIEICKCSSCFCIISMLSSVDLFSSFFLFNAFRILANWPEFPFPLAFPVPSSNFKEAFRNSIKRMKRSWELPLIPHSLHGCFKHWRLICLELRLHWLLILFSNLERRVVTIKLNIINKMEIQSSDIGPFLPFVFSFTILFPFATRVVAITARGLCYIIPVIVKVNSFPLPSSFSLKHDSRTVVVPPIALPLAIRILSLHMV